MITKVDDQLITDSDSLVATVRSYRPGDTVTLTVQSSSNNGQSTGDSHTVDVEARLRRELSDGPMRRPIPSTAMPPPTQASWRD